MSDVLNRDEKEAYLARLLGREFSRFRGVALGLIAEMATAMGLPATVWQEHKDKLLSIVAPFVLRVATDQAGGMMDDFSFIGVDWGLVNERAAQWADRYSFDLVTGINRTSERNLQRAVSAYFEQQQTIGQLQERLSGTFGPVRAEMIAVTEVTRAASEGEHQIERELAAQGITLTPIWQTNNDELVCPICGPKHGKPITDGERPPAHPRCRCWVTHEVDYGE